MHVYTGLLVAVKAFTVHDISATGQCTVQFGMTHCYVLDACITGSAE